MRKCIVDLRCRYDRLQLSEGLSLFEGRPTKSGGPLRLTEVEQDEERCLGAMLHWRDPVERLKTLRRRSHTLVDDNSASG